MSLNIEYVTFIVCVNDGTESFLSCCIPDLHFDYFLIDVDGLESEVYSDCDHVILIKIIICES